MLNKIINFTIALIISSAIIFLIFDWLVMPFYIRKGNSVIVMNLQGKKIDRALKELNAEGFKGEVFDTLYTSKVEPGTVIDQYPVSGNRVKKGRTIRLKISQHDPVAEKFQGNFFYLSILLEQGCLLILIYNSNLI